MEVLSFGTSAISVVGTVLENVVSILMMLIAVIQGTWDITRAIFNPLYFGFIFLGGFTYAWFRMEQIAEAKRVEANSRILLKRSSDRRIALVQYTDMINGQLFSENSFMDILKSMASKGKTPLKMASICQPVVRPSEPYVLWESAYVRIKTLPLHEKHRLQLFDYIRSTSTLSIKDATNIVSHGGLGYWYPKKGFFHKEHTVFLALNFHDSTNFFGLYADSHLLKRLCSVSAQNFFNVPKVDTNKSTISFEGVDNIRFHDPIFFNALCLLICHSEYKNEAVPAT